MLGYVRRVAVDRLAHDFAGELLIRETGWLRVVRLGKRSTRCPSRAWKTLALKVFEFGQAEGPWSMVECSPRPDRRIAFWVTESAPMAVWLMVESPRYAAGPKQTDCPNRCPPPSVNGRGRKRLNRRRHWSSRPSFTADGLVDGRTAPPVWSTSAFTRACPLIP